jgi:hypothetical protein
MRQDERRDLSRVPPNRPGRVPTSWKERDAPIRSLWLGPLLIGAFRRLCVLIRAIPTTWPLWRKWLVFLVWLVGLVVQVVLVVLASMLVDLSISLMELWLELARKHLEIVLSE